VTSILPSTLTANPIQTVPTGFAALPPPGPATPVTDTAISTPNRSTAPAAIEDTWRDAEEFGFYCVVISDDAAFERGRGAWNCGDGCANETACAAFCCGYGDAFFGRGIDELLGLGEDIFQGWMCHAGSFRGAGRKALLPVGA